MGAIPVLHYGVTMPAHLHTHCFTQPRAQELCETQLLTTTWVHMPTLPLIGLMAWGTALVLLSEKNHGDGCTSHAHSCEIRVLILVEIFFKG